MEAQDAREIVYAAVGLGILIRGSFEGNLTPESVGAALFLLGLIPATRADRRRRNGNGA